MSLVGGDNCFQTLGLVVFCEKLPGFSHFFQQGLKGLSSFAPQRGHCFRVSIPTETQFHEKSGTEFRFCLC